MAKEYEPKEWKIGMFQKFFGGYDDIILKLKMDGTSFCQEPRLELLMGESERAYITLDCYSQHKGTLFIDKITEAINEFKKLENESCIDSKKKREITRKVDAYKKRLKKEAGLADCWIG